MTTMVFDTYAAVKKLKEAGFTEQQAEAQITLLAEIVENDLATKRDIAELRKDIEVLRADLKRDMAETKADLIRWMVGAGIFQTALIAALLLRLVH